MTIFGRSLGIIAGAAALFAVGLAPAKASYMITCDKLIAAEAECLAGGDACKEETQAILDECRCHVKKGDEWKLVMAAVAKDGVCGKVPDEVEDPGPIPPHEPQRDVHDPGKGGEGRQP